MVDRTYIIVINDDIGGYQGHAEAAGLTSDMRSHGATQLDVEMKVREKMRERWGRDARCVEVRRPR